MKKAVALLLIVSLVACFASCENNGDDTKEPTKEYFLPTKVVEADISLPYTSADSFEPYSLKSALNYDVVPLIYESLYNPTSDGKGQAVLATSGEVEGLTVTVKLRQDVVFSDGTGFTAKQVVASLLKARASEYYASLVSNIENASAVDNYTVRFTLSKCDEQVLNTLSFPIVLDKNSQALGTGMYELKRLDDGSPYLEAVKSHRDYSAVRNKQIELFDMAGISNPVYPFKSGEISVYKDDLSDGKYQNLSSLTVSVPTYRFVYVGVNSNWASSLTSLEYVRQAINIGISRSEIASGSFLGQNAPCVTPFKSEFIEPQGLELASVDGEAQRAIAILERNGFDSVGLDGVRTNGSTSLYVSILVCSENQYKLGIAECLKKPLERLGFGVTVNVADTAEAFKSALNDGHYGLYIGETVLTPNSDLSQFFTSSGELNYGIGEDMFKSYADYRSQKGSLKNFYQAFSTDVPIIPLFYRNAVVAVNSDIKNVTSGDCVLYSQAYKWETSK